MTRVSHGARYALRFAAVVALTGTFGLAGPAEAALTRAELTRAEAGPAPDARLPLDSPLMDAEGGTRSLQQRLGGKPALLVMADTRCTQLCGPILSIVGQALAGSGLAAGRDYGLLVVSFNPAATRADSLAMRAAQLGSMPDVAAAAQLLDGTNQAGAAIGKALGYTPVFDAEADRFAHPTDVFAITPDGRLSRELGGLSLDGATVRLALVEAGQGTIGTIADRLHLLCYGLDPATGRYTGQVVAALRLGAGLTMAGLAALVVLLVRRRTEKGRGA